jgi:hypothetical protein
MSWITRFLPNRQSPPANTLFNATPVAQDFLTNEMIAFTKSISHPIQLHRKLWEWAFIAHHLKREGMIAPSSRGLAFGVGKEMLPALFASNGCEIVATDGPSDIVKPDWALTNQHAADRENIYYAHIIDRAVFERNVSFETCDMNAISSHLRGFDFCWSSCCFEHLGDLEAGLRFVENSLDCLKPGGVAVHTTEFNLSSNTDTITEGDTCLYRSRDIEELHNHLHAAGHAIRPLSVVRGFTDADRYVDSPPFRTDIHLKLRIGSYDCTSYGIVIKKNKEKTK